MIGRDDDIDPLGTGRWWYSAVKGMTVTKSREGVGQAQIAWLYRLQTIVR